MLFTQLQASFSSKEMFIKKEVRWTLYTGSLNISIRSLNSVFYPKMEVVTSSRGALSEQKALGMQLQGENTGNFAANGESGQSCLHTLCSGCV